VPGVLLISWAGLEYQFPCLLYRDVARGSLKHIITLTLPKEESTARSASKDPDKFPNQKYKTRRKSTGR